MDLALSVLSGIFLISGCFFLFVGSLGLIRLPDFWARLHAASIVDSAGVGLLIFGMMLHSGLTLVTVKLALIVLFLLITGPTASHAVANAAFVSGSKPKDLIEDVTDPDFEPSTHQAEAAPLKSAKPKSKRAEKSNN